MIEIPTWLANLPKNAGVNLKEFSSAIGINQEALRFRVKNGSMGAPKPDFNPASTEYRRKNRDAHKWEYMRARKINYWKAVTVRNYIRHLNRKEMEGKL